MPGSTRIQSSTLAINGSRRCIPLNDLARLCQLEMSPHSQQTSRTRTCHLHKNSQNLSNPLLPLNRYLHHHRLLLLQSHTLLLPLSTTTHLLPSINTHLLTSANILPHLHLPSSLMSLLSLLSLVYSTIRPLLPNLCLLHRLFRHTSPRSRPFRRRQLHHNRRELSHGSLCAMRNQHKLRTIWTLPLNP